MDLDVTGEYALKWKKERDEAIEFLIIINSSFMFQNKFPNVHIEIDKFLEKIEKEE